MLNSVTFLAKSFLCVRSTVLDAITPKDEFIDPLRHCQCKKQEWNTEYFSLSLSLCIYLLQFSVACILALIGRDWLYIDNIMIH